MKLVCVATLLAGTALLAVPAAGATAASDPASLATPGPVSWKTSGLAGVEAHGTYIHSGVKMRLTGTLSDTADDHKAAGLDVRVESRTPSGTFAASIRHIKDTKGPDTSVPVSVVASNAMHVSVREVLIGTGGKTGPWQSLF